MTSSPAFHTLVLREWIKLGATTRAHLKAKLNKRTPHEPFDRLLGAKLRKKDNIRSSAYRLVYGVDDKTVALRMNVVGKRDRTNKSAPAQRP
jgi:mRNA-degrading endonuclease RelE of RelBE toxin-antitoxin system